MNAAVIILSGGMDSGVLLAKRRSEQGKLLALSFDYGAKHNRQELAHATRLCEKYAVPHQVVALPFISNLFRSSLLTGGEPIPEGTYNEVNMRSTVVPFRNGIMLSVAIGLAENMEVSEVLIGSHAGDRAVYPDCRAEFTEAISRAAEEGTYNRVRVLSPFNKLTKGQIAEIGRSLDFDFSLTWSCYKGETQHCGVCGACNERKVALRHGEGLDPTTYRQ